jgi:hypothetical protein
MNWVSNRRMGVGGWELGRSLDRNYQGWRTHEYVGYRCVRRLSQWWQAKYWRGREWGRSRG